MQTKHIFCVLFIWRVQSVHWKVYIKNQLNVQYTFAQLKVLYSVYPDRLLYQQWTTISWMVKGNINTEKLYIIEYTLETLWIKSSQGYYCVQTALNTSFALSLAANNLASTLGFYLTQLLNLADKPDVYSLLLQILCIKEELQDVQ